MFWLALYAVSRSRDSNCNDALIKYAFAVSCSLDSVALCWPFEVQHQLYPDCNFSFGL